MESIVSISQIFQTISGTIGKIISTFGFTFSLGPVFRTDKHGLVNNKDLLKKEFLKGGITWRVYVYGGRCVYPRAE